MALEIPPTFAIKDGGPPNPEVVERPKRRTFTAEYRLSIVRQADACSASGEIGALLRREGLYSSHLAKWRHQRDAGALLALGERRGRKPASRAEVDNARLKRENARLTRDLEIAHRVIDIQGKVSALLGITLESAVPPETAP